MQHGRIDTPGLGLAWLFAVAAHGLAQAPVRDFAAAELAVPAAFPALASNRDGWNFRLAPDRAHAAWLAVRDGKRLASTEARQLEVLLGDAAAAAPRAVKLHDTADWPDWAARGPVWTADGKRVLVGYTVVDEDRFATACVDAVALDGTVRLLVRRENARLLGLAAAPLGDTFAASFCESYPTERREAASFAIFDGKGASVREQASGTAGPALAFSPDGMRLAFASDQALHTCRVDRGAPERVCELVQHATSVAPPQWLADGNRLVVATAGDITLAEVGKGLLRQWTERDLGGRAAAVVVLPGDTMAAAVVEREVDGGPVAVLKGAGHAPKQRFADVVFLQLGDGKLRRSQVSAPVSDRGLHSLPYLPRITELLARYAR